MLSFKSFLLEYLTDDQRDRYQSVKMTRKARKATDHFFGVGNDKVYGTLDNTVADKSETHKKVERHLGSEISPAEYKVGMTKDKYGRDARIGRMIKDSKLRDEFAKDSTREGSRNKQAQYTTSTVRGIEVAGQTNSAPNKDHPKGHSWGGISCKNVDDGDNRHYLKSEIRHGTVVHFIHDHNGQEIYRATLHPYHNESGDVAYALDSEYGIKHPSFTNNAHEVAGKLSGEYKPGVYTKHSDVYDDNGISTIMHPNATPEHISKALNDEDWAVRSVTIQHPKATPEHISKALNDKDWVVRKVAIQHPNATPEHISKALNDKYRVVREAAIRHPNATPEHISKALNDEDLGVREAAIQHLKATPEHISKALNDEYSGVRGYAIKHPNTTLEHISKALNDKDWAVRRAAIQHLKATPEHISKALNDEDWRVRYNAIQHSNATPEHISKALNDKNSDVRREATRRANATPEHISKALNDENWNVRRIANDRSKDLK